MSLYFIKDFRRILENKIDVKRRLLPRMSIGESDKEGRSLGRGLSRVDRQRLDDRSDKERMKDENRFLRERAREAAKWAALHPLDDLEVLLNPLAALQYTL